MITPAQLLEHVADYIQANAHRLRGQWVNEDRATLVSALGWHALHGHLRVEWSPSPNSPTPSPIGLAIVWQDFRSEVERCHRQKKSVFRWLPPLPTGDCLYCALVITTAPGVLPKLAAYFRHRFPPLPELAHRRDRLVEFAWLNRLTTHNYG